MSCKITKNQNVEAFAAKLLNEPYFKDGTLTLYADVPVKCIHYNQLFHICGSNPCTDRDRYAQVVIDFVVCHDDSVLLCICFDENEMQHDTMFKTYLHGMEYVRHNYQALEPADLEQLYASVMDKLYFFTDYKLTSESYSLPPVEIQTSMQEMQSKRFLCEDEMSLFYTRDCGLFVRCSLGPEGGVIREPLTSDAMSETFFEALNWKPEETYCTNDLRKLLEMPLEEFFRMRKDTLHFLRQNLTVVKRRMDDPEGRECAAYGDCLRLLRDIREKIRNPGIDRRERDWLDNAQKSILCAFSEIMSKWYIPFFQLPLLHYFTAAANLAGCYYPIWLYRSRIYPHLCNRPKDCVAVSELVQVCMPHILSSEQPAAPLMLHELMTAPVCVPEAQ